MEIIKTIDLWTEQHNNHYECFNGAFVDGFWLSESEKGLSFSTPDFWEIII